MQHLKYDSQYKSSIPLHPGVKVVAMTFLTPQVHVPYPQLHLLYPPEPKSKSLDSSCHLSVMCTVIMIVGLLKMFSSQHAQNSGQHQPCRACTAKLLQIQGKLLSSGKFGGDNADLFTRQLVIILFPNVYYH